MTLKHATISVEGMFLKVTLLMAFPVISVVKNASGVTMSWGEDPRVQINKIQHIIRLMHFFLVNINASGWQKISDYDKDIPQSYTADQTMAP